MTTSRPGRPGWWSMSGRSDCDDNAVMDAFFPSLKTERADRFESCGEAEMASLPPSHAPARLLARCLRAPAAPRASPACSLYVLVIAGVSGEPGRNRTFNQQIKSLLLCQLSYGPTRGGTRATLHDGHGHARPLMIPGASPSRKRADRDAPPSPTAGSAPARATAPRTVRGLDAAARTRHSLLP